MSQEEKKKNSDRMMGFYDHLDELRIRLMRCLYAFVVGFGICYSFADRMLGVLNKPLFDALPADQRKLHALNLFETFFTHLKISAYASLLLFAPYFFYQIWGFISPGLYERERKLVVPFVGTATLFFLGGSAFAYFVLMPVGFKYFISYGGPDVMMMLTVAAYYDVCMKLLLLFGLAFELPVIICLLGYLGVVDAEILRKKRSFAIIAIAVVSALVAPPDAVSMLILIAPLVLMFEGSIWVVQWMGVKKKTRASHKEEPVDPLKGQSKP